MSTHIGTSGWGYAHWQDVLYPAGTPVYERLSYYTQHFHTVELNSSYYHWPKVSTFTSWRRHLPEGFVMSVKAPAWLTHAQRLYDPDGGEQAKSIQPDISYPLLLNSRCTFLLAYLLYFISIFSDHLNSRSVCIVY